LAGRFIRQFSQPGDWVLDPCCGAGTTLAMAMDLGRRAVGMDVDVTAVETAAKWLRETQGAWL
jgi:DNA modification methylase